MSERVGHVITPTSRGEISTPTPAEQIALDRQLLIDAEAWCERMVNGTASLRERTAAVAVGNLRAVRLAYYRLLDYYDQAIQTVRRLRQKLAAYKGHYKDGGDAA